MTKAKKNPIPTKANKKTLTKKQKKELADLELLIERCEERGYTERVKRYKELLKSYK
jgi:hypothetical protein